MQVLSGDSLGHEAHASIVNVLPSHLHNFEPDQKNKGIARKSIVRINTF